MAQYLAAGGFVMPGSVGAYLREALPDDYIVVCEPTVNRCPMGAVVVGRAGLTLIVTEEDHPGDEQPEAVQRRALAATSEFFAAEFPTTKPPVRFLAAERDADAHLPLWRAREHVGTRDETLAETITVSDTGEAQWTGDDERERIALALRDRQLTASMRASKPFTFRSGGPVRVGARAWTVNDVVRHMDRHPDDGIYHLRNGTLAAWLEEEGAYHLSKLARDAVTHTRGDFRSSLELFLIGTGLVQRPILDVRPRVVDLGYLLAGKRRARAVKIRNGSRRGYLFGELTPAVPWLHIEPRSFAGGVSEAVISADTSNLGISSEPYRAEIRVDTSASDEPLAIPVVMRVVAQPSPIMRFGLRPLAAVAVGVVAGMTVGWLWAFAGLPVPDGLRSMGTFGALNPWVWVLGLVFGFFGLLRGLNQPPAWPARYATVRWLGRLLLWGVGLGLLAMAVAWAWRQSFGGALAGVPLWLAGIVGAALGVIPASLGETAMAQPAADPHEVLGRRSAARVVVWSVIGVVLLIAALLSPRVLRPLISDLNPQQVVEPAKGWLANAWVRLNDSADSMFNSLMMRFYDRRAPVATPTPRPPATPTPTP